MSDIIKTSKMLVALVLHILILQADSRFLSSFSVRTSPEDLSVAGAEPRPVFVEQEKHPQVLPLVADVSDFGDSPSEASEKVEKVLRRPAAFSYRNRHPTLPEDPVQQEALVISNAKIVPEESRSEEIVADQKPSAIDYYKHIKKLESEDDGGAGNAEAEKAEEEVEQEIQSEADDSGRGNEEQELDHEAIVKEVSKENEEHENLNSDAYDKIDDKEEYNREEDDDHDHYEVHEKQGDSGAGGHAGHGHGKAGDNGGGSHGGSSGGHGNKGAGHGGGAHGNEGAGHGGGGSSHGNGGTGHGGGGHGNKGAGHGGGESSHGNGGTGHGGGGGGHGGNGEFEKGGGKEHHENHESSHGEKGDKGYKGHHHDEKGEKGHHIKEDHSKEYEEKGGSNKKHHHDDGYHADHHHGEKGEKGHKFSEEGKHSKGHSTKGEHNIRKKEEFEKKQEFFDESHEEGGFEKDGSFFHEDDFNKGGFEKGGHKKGDQEESHYGKKYNTEKGGHHKEVKGHKGSGGLDSHHDHVDKHGEKESHSGGKKWKYNKGTGNGGGDHGGAGGGHGHAGGGHGHAGGGHGAGSKDGGGGGDHGKYSVHESSNHDANAQVDGTHADIHDTSDDVEKESAEIEDETELEDDESRIVLKRNYSFDGIPLPPKYSEVSKDETLQTDIKRDLEPTFGKQQKRRDDNDEELIRLAEKNRQHEKPGAYKVFVLGDYTTSTPLKIETAASDVADVVFTSENKTPEGNPEIEDSGSAETVNQPAADVFSTKMAPIVVKDNSAEASDILIMFIENGSSAK